MFMPKKSEKEKREDKRTRLRIPSFLRRSRSGTVIILVDGPNILRRVDGEHMRLEDILEISSQLGKSRYAKVFLDKKAPEKLLQAIVNTGFEPVVVPTDIHVHMALEAMKGMHSKNVKTIVIASRHARCTPILRKAKENGLETCSIGFEPGFSIALQNASDYVFKVKGNTLKVEGKSAKT